MYCCNWCVCILLTQSALMSYQVGIILQSGLSHAIEVGPHSAGWRLVLHCSGRQCRLSVPTVNLTRHGVVSCHSLVTRCETRESLLQVVAPAVQLLKSCCALPEMCHICSPLSEASNILTSLIRHFHTNSSKPALRFVVCNIGFGCMGCQPFVLLPSPASLMV